MTETQELHCHECGRYVQFPIDLALDGNHVLECPNCGHEHCRVVRDGIITGERWGSRNGPTYQVSVYVMTTSATSTSMSFFQWASSGSAAWTAS